MVKAKINTIVGILFIMVISLSGCGAVLSPSEEIVDGFVVAKDVNSARADIEEAGGRIVHIFPDDKVLMGKVPKKFRSESISKIYYEDSKRVPSDKSMLFNIFIKNLEWKKMPVEEKLARIPSGIEPIYDDVVWEESTKLSELSVVPKAMLSGASLTDTSLYMIGDISVSIITPESIGGSEDWTQEELNNVYSEIALGMDWWVAREPASELTFVYTYEEQIPVSFEPIEESSSWRYYWINETMDYLGIGSVNYPNPITPLVYDYINLEKGTADTDWGFVFFVVDSSNDVDGKFSDGKFAFTVSQLHNGGVYVVMTYDNQNYGIDDMDGVAAHEMGHVFGAADQYYGSGCICTSEHGYLSYENQNCENGCPGSANPSIMKHILDAYPIGAVDSYARGQVGWQDIDPVDGVLDIVGTTPNIDLFDYPLDMTDEELIEYFGNSSINIYPAINPNYNDVSIDRITDVLYGFDRTFPEKLRTIWSSATGTFDLPEVDYLFTYNNDDPADWGFYTFKAKPVSRFSNSQPEDTDDINLVGCLDEDGGIDWFNKSHIINYDGSNYGNETDYCVDGSNLVEYYCDGYNIVSQNKFCKYGCGDGMCSRKQPIIRYYPMQVPAGEGRI